MDLFYLVILKFSRIRKRKSLEDTTFFKNVIQISNEKILLLIIGSSPRETKATKSSKKRTLAALLF